MSPDHDGVRRPLRFVVIGAGMAGILSAIKLREAGFGSVAVYEKADRLGGTWRDNTYPGIACDIPSHLYRYSFAPNPNWTHTFAPGPEILAYLEGVAERFGVTDAIQLNTEVTRLRHDGERWQVELSNGSTDQADVVIGATGVLHHPRYPDIDGLGTFGGACFHSARWDHSVELTGRRVGIIGTGSSAVQIVSAIIGTVGNLYLFQRTPQWILPVPNPPIDEEQRAVFRQDPASMDALRKELAHTFETSFANAVVDANSPQMAFIEEMCRQNLENSVRDPELRERLRPDYRPACKRLVVSPDFYEAIQQPNAHLITEKILRIEPQGVRTTDGTLHELDVLVLATGFRVDQFLRPIEVTGPTGVTLEELWAQRPYAYYSISIPGLPNLFLLNGPNGPVGNFSLIDVAELQFDYISQLIDLIARGEARLITATTEATERFEQARVDAARNTVWVTGCRSWYLDDRGIPSAWPWSFDRFRAEMAAPRLEDFELVR
ncbi:MAG: NAD(P)/FAD-dependent oxidoreductase [Acidimicrobiales bacterium]|nr:NAD(P)/FAD-dependent oxidoreductase [Acidimicrobiales bacterium]